MEFTLFTDDANKLMRFAKVFAKNSKESEGHGHFHNRFNYIKCEIDAESGKLLAAMMNGYSICRIELHAEASDSGTCYIFPCDNAFKKKDVIVTITGTDTYTDYKTATGVIRVQRGDEVYDLENRIIDTWKADKVPKGYQYMNTSSLANALSAFGKGCLVKIEFLEKLEGVYIKDSLGNAALVLPVRVGEEW